MKSNETSNTPKDSPKKEEKKDFSTEILDQKKAPNHLFVEEAIGLSEDNSVIQLTQNKMDELKIKKTETVLLKSKKCKETICVAFPDDAAKLTDDKIRLNKVIRNNLCVRLGEVVTIHKYPNVPIGIRVHILPFEDSIEGISVNLTQTYLKPYFKDAYRPVHKGDCFVLRGGYKSVEFKVVETVPDKFCIVCPKTVILDEGDPIIREVEENTDDVDCDDISGCGKQLDDIKEMIELPLEEND